MFSAAELVGLRAADDPAGSYGGFYEEEVPRAATPLPTIQVVMGLAGAALLVAFLCDAALLGAMAGAPLRLSFAYLIGGLVLAAGALVPLPTKLRAVVAALVGAVPLLAIVPHIVGVTGWRGLAAALAVVLLPGALLVRAGASRSELRLARRLVAVAALLAALVYLVPADDVVPLTIATGLLRAGTLGDVLCGLFFVAPLVLAALALTTLRDGDRRNGPRLLAGLTLMTVAGALAVAGLVLDDGVLAHLGVGLLGAGAAAALGLAGLLAPAAA